MPSSVWKGYVSFGLVTFPIHLATAARPQTMHFHMLHSKDLSRIKEVWYCSEEDKPVRRGDIVKGYEVEKGEYVVVEDADLKRIAPSTSNAVEILQFVRESEVDPIYLEKSYYVVAENGAEKPYQLLAGAMRDTKYYAVGKVAMHGREHVVLIRPTDEGLILHTMYFENELNKAHQMHAPPKSKPSSNEMKLAKQLIDSLAAPFKPEQFEDDYRKNIEHLIEQKQRGQKISTIKQPKRARVVDIVQALQQSLKQSASKRTTAKPPVAKRAVKRRTTAA
jgi:DNA end-binding protein Ku